MKSRHRSGAGVNTLLPVAVVAQAPLSREPRLRVGVSSPQPFSRPPAAPAHVPVLGLPLSALPGRAAAPELCCRAPESPAMATTGSLCLFALHLKRKSHIFCLTCCRFKCHGIIYLSQERNCVFPELQSLTNFTCIKNLR